MIGITTELLTAMRITKGVVLQIVTIGRASTS